jgi:hypothetical protein
MVAGERNHAVVLLNFEGYDGCAALFRGFLLSRLPITESIMSDIPTLELIENLQRSVRRWKTLALTLLVGLGLVIIVGGTVTAVQAQRARQDRAAAQQAEMEARQQAK